MNVQYGEMKVEYGEFRCGGCGVTFPSERPMFGDDWFVRCPACKDDIDDEKRPQLVSILVPQEVALANTK